MGAVRSSDLVRFTEFVDFPTCADFVFHNRETGIRRPATIARHQICESFDRKFPRRVKSCRVRPVNYPRQANGEIRENLLQIVFPSSRTNRFRMHRRVLHFIALASLLGTLLGGRQLLAEQVEPEPAAQDQTEPAASAAKASKKTTTPIEVQISGGYIGTWFTEEDDETRILLLKAIVTNRHEAPITVSRKAWKLNTEGRNRSAIDVPPEITGVTVSINGERVAMNGVKTETLKIPPAESATAWLLFKNLPDSDQIPEMMLTCDVPNVAVVKVDVAKTFASRLKLRSQLIGPAKSIALLTIDGTLDTVNTGELAQKIDEISATQICRVIVNFGPNAKSPDQSTAGWLRTVAVQSGRAPVVNDNFPPLPSTLVDFHVVNYRVVPPNVARTLLHSTIRGLCLNLDGGPPSSRNSHSELVAAVDSAVAPLCEILPPEELLRAVREGDDATKAAVLRRGAERLVKNNLPLILSLTEDRNLNVAAAAIFALRTSGDSRASQKLVELARTKNLAAGADARSVSEVRRTVAVHSLAGSKYATAHPEVIALLSENDADEFLITQTCNAIESHPRPMWSEPLATLMKQSPEKSQVHLIQALAAVGHPRLLTILERCLAASERRLSAEALNILIARKEPAAEQLTSKWMLKSLESSSPSPVLLRFLRQTRDHRAVPLLLRHLNETTTDRTELLTTILTIGDHRVAEQIAADFKKYDSNEQLLILKALSEVHSKLFWTLSESIVAKLKTSNDKSLEGIVSLLNQHGGDRAVKLLAGLLPRLVADENRSQRHLAVVCAALASSGTPEARDALRAAAHNSTAKSIARQSLLQLYERSPARRYVELGKNYIGQAMRLTEHDDNIDKVEQARRKAEAQRQISQAILQLNAAIKVDPELPETRRLRGNAGLRIERPTAEQLETARQDFARCVEFEPDEAECHTGLALVLVRQGKVEDGISAGLAIEETAKKSSVYAYNMACIYGRAIEQLESHPDHAKPEQQSRIKDFRSRGVTLLQQSIDNGLDDSNLDWMTRDPDLKTIRQSPAFKKLLESTKLPSLPDGLQPE